MLYQIVDYPNALELNPSLHRLIRSNIKNSINGGGNRTGWTFGLDTKEFDVLIRWIEELIPSIAHNFARGVGSNSGDYGSEKYLNYLANNLHGNGGGELGYDPQAFKIIESWGITYRKGQGVNTHNHYPYSLSFSYYVNMPEGSSPLVFEHDKVEMKEGQIIFFQGHVWHMVPPSDVSGRSVLAGNISYSPTK